MRGMEITCGEIHHVAEDDHTEEPKDDEDVFNLQILLVLQGDGDVTQQRHICHPFRPLKRKEEGVLDWCGVR